MRSLNLHQQSDNPPEILYFSPSPYQTEGEGKRQIYAHSQSHTRKQNQFIGAVFILKYSRPSKAAQVASGSLPYKWPACLLADKTNSVD